MFTPPDGHFTHGGPVNLLPLPPEFSVLVESTQRETGEPVGVVQICQGNGAFFKAPLHDENGAGLFFEFIEEDRGMGSQAHNQVALFGPLPKRLG